MVQELYGWMKRMFLTDLKHKGEACKRQKQYQDSWMEYVDIAQVCREGIRELAKAQLVLQ